MDWSAVMFFNQTLILTAPIHCRASIDSHSDGNPFTAEHPLTLILTAPIHCRASIGLSFWRQYPFTAEHPLTLILTAPIHLHCSIHWLSFWRHPFTAEHPLDSHSDGTHSLQSNPLTLILTAPFTAVHPLTLISERAPIHPPCRASIDSHSDGTPFNCPSIPIWLSFDGPHSLAEHPLTLDFWRHPFTAEQPLTLILTAPIHCSASIDSHSDGTYSLQSIHWLSFWRHPFTAEHPLTLILTAPIHCRASVSLNLMKKQTHLVHFVLLCITITKHVMYGVWTLTETLLTLQY